jgi:hypothetical protein
MPQDATYLFEKPNCNFHNSESWWSGFFSTLLLYLACNRSATTIIPTKTLRKGSFHEAPGLNIRNLRFQNVVVEGRLSKHSFGLPDWPDDFADLKPDVTIVYRDIHRAVLIENKTIGASIAPNVDKYLQLRDYLRRDCQWEAELYYLISCGHETHRDWELIADYSLALILWEDVLRIAADTPFGEIFGLDLREYAEIS